MTGFVKLKNPFVASHAIKEQFDVQEQERILR